jgi:hypothetical protein
LSASAPPKEADPAPTQRLSETALLPAPFWCTKRVESAHFDWHWRERPALALLAWEACSRSAEEATPHPTRVNWNGNQFLGQGLSPIAPASARDRLEHSTFASALRCGPRTLTSPSASTSAKSRGEPLLNGRKRASPSTDRMSPSFSSKNGILYRFYVSSALLRGRRSQEGSVGRGEITTRGTYCNTGRSVGE